MNENDPNFIKYVIILNKIVLTMAKAVWPFSFPTMLNKILFAGSSVILFTTFKDSTGSWVKYQI